jgi:hypothetical protein
VVNTTIGGAAIVMNGATIAVAFCTNSSSAILVTAAISTANVGGNAVLIGATTSIVIGSTAVGSCVVGTGVASISVVGPVAFDADVVCLTSAGVG